MAPSLLCKDARRLLANMLMCRRCQMDPNCTSEICDFGMEMSIFQAHPSGTMHLKWNTAVRTRGCLRGSGPALITFPIVTSDLHLNRNPQLSLSLPPLEEMSGSEFVRRQEALYDEEGSRMDRGNPL